MNKFTHKVDALGYWLKDNSSMIPLTYKLNTVDIHRFLSSQFRSATMNALEYEVVCGLMDGMSVENLAKFREYTGELGLYKKYAGSSNPNQV